MDLSSKGHVRPLSGIFQFWSALRDELGLGDMSIRDLRHVFAKWQLGPGLSPQILQRGPGMEDMRHRIRHIA